MSLGLTKRQKELLIFIREYVTRNGESPTYEQMRVGVGLSSKSGIFRLIKALEERGHIVYHPNRARSVAPVGMAVKGDTEDADVGAVVKMANENHRLRSAMVRAMTALRAGTAAYNVAMELEKSILGGES